MTFEHDDDWIEAAQEIIAGVSGWSDVVKDARSLRMVAFEHPPPGLGRLVLKLHTGSDLPHQRFHTTRHIDNLYAHEALVSLSAGHRKCGEESLHVIFRVHVVNEEDLDPVLNWCRETLGLPFHETPLWPTP